MDRRPAALGALLFVLTTSCGTNLAAAEPLTDTKTLVADARTELGSADSYHMVVSYQQGTQVDVTADLRFKGATQLSGAITENGNMVNVVQTGGATYVQGKDFLAEYGGSFDGTLFGDRWVLLTPDLLRTDVLDTTKMAALPSYFLGLDVGTRRVDHVQAATESTAELESTWGNMYISELPPHRLVKVEATNGFVTADGFAGVSFELLEYGESVDIQPPGDVADIADPTTLPPDYELTAKANVPPCSNYRCAMSGTVVNKGGAYPPLAASTFTFTVYDASPAQRPIDHCSGRIPTLAHGATTGIACAISSAAWRAYGGSSFYWDVKIDNPNYDG